MAKQDTNTGIDKADMMKVGAGIAAVAAGAYFFFGPEGKKHQKKMKGWMVRMKGEVLEKLEEAQEITEPVYHQIVDTIAKANEVNGRIPKEEIMALAMDLKKQWRTIKKNANSDKTKTKSVAKKTAKAVSKKSKPKAKK